MSIPIGDREYHAERIAEEARRILNDKQGGERMSELKPCPFCGGELQVTVLGEEFYQSVLGTDYECEPDYVLGHVDRLAAAKARCPFEMVSYRSEADAIDACNTRADFEFGGIPCTEENMKAHGWIRERTCRVESVSLIDWWEYTTANYYEFEMECGGCFKWDWREPPDYCPNCGARVKEDE